MFFLPIVGNHNLEFRSGIIVFRKHSLLPEALVLRKDFLWTQPLRMINLLLCYLQAQDSASLEISSSLRWRHSEHSRSMVRGQLQSLKYKISMLLLESLELSKVNLEVQMPASCMHKGIPQNV